MPFDIPSILTARDLLVALGQALFPDQNWGSRRSYHGRDATFISGSTSALHEHVFTVERDLHPLTAGDGKPIRDWGDTIGVPPKPATPARKAGAGRIRGNPGSTIPSGTQLSHPQTGLIFKVANVSTITIPAAKFFDADIAGVDVGAQTRLEAGETLVFVGGAPAGCEANVVLQLDLDEDGFDVEQFGSYRGRILETFSSTPSGGSQGDFQRWAVEALPSVQSAYAYPNRAGKGTIDIAAFHTGTGSARSLTLAERDAVKAYIQTQAPFQIASPGGGLRVLVTTPDPQQVEVQVATNGIPSFAFDWPGSLIVLSWTAGTRELRFTTSLPTSLRAGHRLILRGTVGGSGQTAQDGRQYKIESISGADKVILEVVPPVAPAATDIVYSGGPLVDRIRDALKGHLNGEDVYAGRGQIPIPAGAAQSSSNPNGPSIIGLDVLAEGIGPANPGGEFGSWAGGIFLGNIYKIATYVAGVRGITILSPATDYDPADFEFPLDDQVPFVTPSVILIRSA